MSEATTLRLEARIDECERPGLVAAAEQLARCLAQAAGGEQLQVSLDLQPHGDASATAVRPAAVVLSLLPELAEPDLAANELAGRWLDYVKAHQAGGTPVYIRNIFRHVQERSKDGRPTPALERIRRLNRMALEISRETGAAIVDVDRAFAHVGAHDLGCDCRLRGPLAARMSAHATVLCLLSFGMDDTLEPALQEKARAFHGNLDDARRRITGSKL